MDLDQLQFNMPIKQEITEEDALVISGLDSYIDLDVDVKIEDYTPCTETELLPYSYIEDWDGKPSRIFLESANVFPGDLYYPRANACALCDEIFINRYNLIKHNLTHLRVILHRTNYQCDTGHIQDSLQTDIPLHECVKCHKWYKYKIWHDHKQYVHSEKSYKCDKCNSSFKCKKYLKRHLQTHVKVLGTRQFRNVGNERFPCTQCVKVFHRQQSLTCHKKNVHGDMKQHKCDKCQREFKSLNYLRSHTQRVHYDDGKMHSCQLCGKLFKSPRRVNIHMKNSHSTRRKLKSHI